jgi:hypothetical protein
MNMSYLSEEETLIKSNATLIFLHFYVAFKITINFDMHLYQILI